MGHMTFENWLKQPAVQALKEKLEYEHGNAPCEACDGKGVHECSCGDTHECFVCYGTGKGSGESEVELDLKRAYRKQLEEDDQMLSRWLGRPYILPAG